jgi:hypothetical protein
MGSARIIHTPRDAALEGKRDALAAAYRFILDCHAKKKATSPGGPDNAEDMENDRTATEIIPE